MTQSVLLSSSLMPYSFKGPIFDYYIKAEKVNLREMIGPSKFSCTPLGLE